MKFCLKFLAIAFTAFALSSCTHTVREQDHHTSMGEVGELALFSDPETLGQLNEEIEECLSPVIKGNWGGERSYKLRIAKDGILKGFIKKNFVLFILVHQQNWPSIQKQFSGRYIKTVDRFLAMNKDTSFMVSNAWAQPQKVIFVVSPSMESMRAILTEKKDGFHETALIAERQTTIRRVLQNKKESDDFYEDMMQSRKFAHRKPFNYRLSVKSDTFLGIKRDIEDKELRVLSYFEEYTSRDQFTKEYIINKRNEVMKRHIQGPNDADGNISYMSTANEDNVKISVRETEVNGQYAVETRGWYDMVNYKYGGPFVSYTIYSEKLNRVVTIEGMVFAPNRSVARYLREVELIAHTYSEDSTE